MDLGFCLESFSFYEPFLSAGVLLTNFCTFHLSENILPSVLKDIITAYRIIGQRYCSFHHFEDVLFSSDGKLGFG